MENEIMTNEIMEGAEIATCESGKGVKTLVGVGVAVGVGVLVYKIVRKIAAKLKAKRDEKTVIVVSAEEDVEENDSEE